MGKDEAYKLRCSCYPVSVNSAPDKAPFPHQYDFAEECDSLIDFLSSYQDLPLDRLSASETESKTCYYHSLLCDTCRTKHNTPDDRDRNRNCELRDKLFLYKNEITLHLSPKPDSIPKECPNCSFPVFIISDTRSSHTDLSDIRLCGKPTKLHIERERARCTGRNCRRLFGDKRIHGMECYENSGMTLRLTASVLTCHLCGVKRKFLVEAYDIAESQVDRIKSRISKIRKEEAVQADYQNLIRESKHIMQTYFMASGTDKLLDLFFQWDIHTDELKLISAYLHLSVHDVWVRLRHGETTIRNEFDSREAFILAAVDHYIADRNISNSALLEWMAALNLYYTLSVGEGRLENTRDENLTLAFSTLIEHIWDVDYPFLPLLHQFKQMDQQLEHDFFYEVANYVRSPEFDILLKNASDTEPFDRQLPNQWENGLPFKRTRRRNLPNVSTGKYATMPGPLRQQS